MSDYAVLLLRMCSGGGKPLGSSGHSAEKYRNNPKFSDR